MEARQLAVEAVIQAGVQWLRLAVETIGAAVVAAGVLVSLWTVLRSFVARRALHFTRLRLSFARYLALALEFQLAADILSTAIAPDWSEIGKLGAIAVIRTLLNIFLTREMEHERSEIEPHADIRQETPVDG